MNINLVDCDVTAGFWPKSKLWMAPEHISPVLERNGIHEACVVSARGALFDFRQGNREALRWAEESLNQTVRFYPVGTIDLRRYVGYRQEIREMSKAGIRIWRLFPEYQGWDYDHPGFRRVAGAVAEEGGTLFVKGRAGGIIQGLHGCPVSLLIGTHFYDLAEVLALWEEGHRFLITTAQLHGPGAIRTAVQAAGDGCLVFGSGAPFFSPAGAVAVLQGSGLSEEALAKVGAYNLCSLLTGADHGN